MLTSDHIIEQYEILSNNTDDLTMYKDFILIDTHFHPTLLKHNGHETVRTFEDIKEIIETSKKNHVEKLIFVSTNEKDLADSIFLASGKKDLYVSAGIHPCEIATQSALQQVACIDSFCKREFEETRIVAIGEIGLDMHHAGYNLEQQEYVFRLQIECALQHNLPLILHSRKAYDETLTILDEYKFKGPHSGVIHAFEGNLDYAEEWIKRGFLLGVGGMVTYPKHEFLRTAIKKVGPTHITFETDAPFLPPEGFRGTVNSPQHILTIAQFTAHMLGTPLETLAHTVYEQTHATFPLLGA